MQVVSLIPPAARLVMEFGCGDGSSGRQFKQIQPFCRYIGIEERPELAEKAASLLDEVSSESFLTIDFSRMGILPGGIDCLVYHGSYLSGMHWEESLRRQCSFLCRQGQVIFDLTNAGYLRNLLSLWRGEPSCLPGQSLQTLLQALPAAGLRVVDVQPYYSREDEPLRRQPEFLQLLEALTVCGGQPGKTANPWAAGYIIRAVPAEVQFEPLLLQTMVGEQRVCSRVRVVEPASFLQTIPGVRAVQQFRSADLSLGEAYSRKIFIRQRVWPELEGRKVALQRLLDLGYLLIGEMDDDPWRWRDFHEKTDFFAFRACHGIQTSTPALAEVFRQYNPNVAVFANQIRCLPEPRTFDAAAPVTVFFGALNREADWAEIMPAINQLLAGYNERVRVKVVYDKQFFAALETPYKEYIPFCSYEVYEQVLHGSDIAILPLQDTRFNRMKSDLKFIECAAHGVAVLASPTVYAGSIRHGTTGLLYHNVAEFSRLFSDLLGDATLRWNLVQNAYAYVKQERLLAGHYEERYAWYQQLLCRLPELTRELLKRVENL